MNYVRAFSQTSLAILLLGFSACETPEIGLPTRVGTLPPPMRQGAGVPIKEDGGPVLGKREAGKTVRIEGTGRFVGDPPPTQQQHDVSKAAEGVTLNLVNVPTAQAAKTILGDILAVRYTIDPTIKGEITIQTSAPVAKSAIVDLFQSALRSNGAAIVGSKGLYRIVPTDQAIVGAAFQTGNLPGGAEKLGSDLHVVQLKYVAASEIQRVLEPIAPRGSIVRFDDARNTITLSGTRQEIASIMDAVTIFDVDTMKGMSFALVPVGSSQPTTIAEELRTVFASNREGPMAGMVRFLPNNRLKAILVITPQRDYLARAEAWVRRLDTQAQGSEKQFYTYAVQNRRAQDLVSVLQSMFSTETGSGAARNVAPPYQEASLVSDAPHPSTMGPQGYTPAPFGGQGGTGKQVRSAQSPPGGSRQAATVATIGVDQTTGEARMKIAADGGKNALLIEATPADYRRIMRMIGTLDVVPNQVLIEATIAEISLNDDLKMGLRWFLKSKNADYTFTDAASGAVSSVFPGFSYALTAANLSATLNTLNKITDVKVVSSPSLTVMDNSTAVLQIGDQVPITTQSAAVLGAGSSIINSVSYRDTGVILAITPRINASGRVLLEIEQEVSTVASTTSSNIDSPTIRQRRIKTSVFVNDGDALALGGMIQASNNLSRSQLPILGDIPVLGAAFRNKDSEIGRTELIVVITPHVMRNLREASEITEEYRRELAIEGPYVRPRSPNPRQTLRRMLQ